MLRLALSFLAIISVANCQEKSQFERIALAKSIEIHPPSASTSSKESWNPTITILITKEGKYYLSSQSFELDEAQNILRLNKNSKRKQKNN